MVLENISNQYDVLCLLGKGKGFQSYLCRGGDRKWIALWFDASLTQQLFPYFLSLKEEQTFEDLQDVFSWKEGLVVILACASMDRSLKDARKSFPGRRNFGWRRTSLQLFASGRFLWASPPI